jgi:hypothetical protein
MKAYCNSIYADIQANTAPFTVGSDANTQGMKNFGVDGHELRACGMPPRQSPRWCGPNAHGRLSI